MPHESENVGDWVEEQVWAPATNGRNKMKRLCATLLGTVGIIVTSVVFAASSDDIDKLTTFATVLGRGTACGADIKDASRRVGRWMDRTFPPGSKDQQVYLPIFMAGMVFHAQQQKDGKSPDSCPNVLRSFNTFPWP